MLMPKSAKSGPLKISVDDTTVTFSTIDDLKFALEAKTQLPVSKYDELRALSMEALKKQATDIRQVEARLLQILDHSFAEPMAVDYELRDVDIRIFSEDHGWRDLIEALNDQGTEFADFKRVALVKYLQYLANRQDLIKRVYWTKHRETQGEPDVSNLPASGDVRETAIFDANELSGLQGRNSGKRAATPPGRSSGRPAAPGPGNDASSVRAPVQARARRRRVPCG